MCPQRVEVNALAQRQILHIVEKRLLKADVAGVFPTPLDRVAQVVGIEEIIDLSDMPEAMKVKKPKALIRVLGAYVFRARTAFVDLSQPSGRVRFIKAHETGHRIIPWHEESYYFDDEKRLFRNTEELLELEANLAAAHLIFQGPRFFEKALDFERSLNTPIAIADDFGASLHATIRYYIEHHPDPVAGIIAGRYRQTNGVVPIWISIESPNFRSVYGRLTDHLSGGQLRLSEGNAVSEVARAARLDSDVQADHMTLTAENGVSRKFNVEAFFNQRCLFVMVSPHSVLRTGRRVEVAAG
jgi:hypothetical protein